MVFSIGANFPVFVIPGIFDERWGFCTEFYSLLFQHFSEVFEASEAALPGQQGCGGGRRGGTGPALLWDRLVSV